MDVEHL